MMPEEEKMSKELPNLQLRDSRGSLDKTLCRPKFKKTSIGS